MKLMWHFKEKKALLCNIEITGKFITIMLVMAPNYLNLWCRFFFGSIYYKSDEKTETSNELGTQ